MNSDNYGANDIVVRASKLAKGKALDLGAGDGRDTVYLAKQGFNVTAVDSSKMMIHNTQQLCKIHKTNVDCIIGDIVEIDYKENYDIVLCNLVFHFLKDRDVKKVIQKMNLEISFMERYTL